MIPAPQGLVAHFAHTKPDGGIHHTHVTVIAFNNEGRPLILDGDTGRLTPADTQPHYDGVGNDPHPPTIAIIPGGGWHIARQDADGHESSQPLAGWALKPHNTIVPLESDDTGFLHDVNGKYRIYHPDTQNPQGEPDERQ